MSFTGIPIAALDFYDDLEADNSRTFWDANLERYQRDVREPMAALAAELDDEFGTDALHVKLFRPYRDLRFSKDKTPYKDHQGLFFETIPGAGYHLHINAAGLMIGGGFYRPSGTQLARYRAALADRVHVRGLREAMAMAEHAGLHNDGVQLKTRPRGADPDDPNLDLLRYRSLTFGRMWKSPPWLDSTRTLDEARRVWRALKPLVRWSTDVLGADD